MPITVSGTEITFNDATTQSTAAVASGGTVTSVATGNGLSGGTITTSGTLVIACPSTNTVGSYVFAQSTAVIAYGGTAAGGSALLISKFADGSLTGSGGQISGTWRWMANGAAGPTEGGIACRVS